MAANPLISFLLATTGRVDMAERCIKGIRDTAHGHDFEIIVAVDGPLEDADLLGGLGCILDWSPTLRGCSAAWNAALRLSTGEHVVLAADDLIWGAGWLDATLMTLQTLPDGWGLVGFNDGHWGEELSTHYLMSRRFVVEVLGGVIAWDYEHSFNDREANARARLAGRYAWCEDAHVHHSHWLFGERQQDPTDTRLLGMHPEAERKFFDRQAAGFPNAGITPVIVGY